MPSLAEKLKLLRKKKGFSLDQLNLRAGDRLVVPARGDSERSLRILAVLVSIPVAAFTVTRIAH